MRLERRDGGLGRPGLRQVQPDLHPGPRRRDAQIALDAGGLNAGDAGRGGAVLKRRVYLEDIPLEEALRRFWAALERAGALGPLPAESVPLTMRSAA